MAANYETQTGRIEPVKAQANHDHLDLLTLENDELAHLLLTVIDDCASEAERRRLDGLIRSDAEAADLCVNYCQLVYELHNLLGATQFSKQESTDRR